MREVHGTTMHYPWGTTDAIPAILGIPADGKPHAEYWLGAHPLAPAVTSDGRRLNDWIADEPAILGAAAEPFDGRLPYMLKLLSARHALSLQVHPTEDDARRGFAREEENRVGWNDPARSFHDAHGKAEMEVALTRFELLHGFRQPEETMALMRALGCGEHLLAMLAPLENRTAPSALAEVFLDALTLEGPRKEALTELLVAAVAHASDPGPVGNLARLVIDLDATFPGDGSIVGATLMNHVVLQPGQAIVTHPGTMHSIQSGTAIEALTNSDNIIRGGLTVKHIAVEALVDIVDFEPRAPVVLDGQRIAEGVWAYPSGEDAFRVWRLELTASETPLPGHGTVRIALLTRGHATVTDAEGTRELESGQSLLFWAGNSPVTASGDAELFLVGPGLR